jgi:hypothetical protein
MGNCRQSVCSTYGIVGEGNEAMAGFISKIALLEKGRGFPWPSALAMLYPVGAAIRIAMTMPQVRPTAVARLAMVAGYGLANLGYLLFVAGLWPGTFRILVLKKRWQVFASAVLSIAVGTILATFSVPQPRPSAPVGLDSAVQGETSTELWNALSPKVRNLQCLEYKISLMRKLVSTASGPMDLMQNYPSWTEGLAECQAHYPINKKLAEQLREAVATKMETAIGEETSMFLTLQRLNSSHPGTNWLEEWRVFAITGVADVSQALPKEP